MTHLQYMPGDPRLVDQLVYELKSKGIFDQFRKDCIADVDTRPAYQNLRQRVENSVSTFLSRQCWKPDLNKNQLREKLRKHILDGNYLEQGVERIVDQVVNPKVATVFIPQVEDLVYNYLGIPRKKEPGPEASEKKSEDLLPTDLEAVSPGSVKSNDGKNDAMETDEKTEKMEVDTVEEIEVKEDTTVADTMKEETDDVQISEVTVKSNDSESLDKSSIPLPTEEIKLENIPAPVNSPPKVTKVELDSIALPHEPNPSTDIPLPDGTPNSDKDTFFKPVQLNSEDSSSSSDSSLRRNMSPLTPIRSFNNENSCDAQQGFGDDSDAKSDEKAAPSSFRFTIETKDGKSTENNLEIKEDKKEQIDLSYQFNNQVNINTFNTPMYDDSSNSNNLHIDYESDVNSKTNMEIKPEIENSQDSKKEKKNEDRKSSHKSSHRSRDSSRHSSSKDKRSDSKHSTSRDSSRHDKKSSSTRDDKNKSSRDRERSKDRSEKKDSRDSSKHRSSHKSSNSKDKDYKSHRSSSSSHRHSSKDEKKSSSSSVSKDKEKISESSRDKSSKDKSRDSKSSSSRSDKDKKSSSSSGKKPDDKDKKKDKKDVDDHYSISGRGNHSRRSTDRDSNDGSSSSKGSHNQNGSKLAENKKESKAGSSKSDNTSTSGDSPSPSDKEQIIQGDSKISQFKPIVRVDNHLETPIANPPRLPFVPDVTLKKPRFAANLQEAKKLIKMRKFLDEEQKRMNQEAALLLEFQANVRPSLSQVYSSIPGPELEFACVTNVIADDSTPYEVTNVQIVESEKTAEEEGKDTEKDKETVNMPEAILAVETESIQSPDDTTNVTRVNSDAVESNEIILENIESNKPLEIQTDKLKTVESPEEPEENNDNSYDENKPFSELMDEITEYSKASEVKTKTDIEEPKLNIEDQVESGDLMEREEETPITSNMSEPKEYLEVKETTKNVENKYFEVTIITEELSESEETEADHKKAEVEEKTENKMESENTEEIIPKLLETELKYFAEHEKYNAELERHEFSSFLKKYMDNLSANKRMYLINCDTYEENIIKEMAATFGDFEIVNYYKNGHLKLPNTSKNIVKDVTLSAEISLPIESTDEIHEYKEKSPLFSPIKSECSFELSSDYDAKLDDINKKSRQEVMEIILGSILDASPSKMPKIDYYTESSVENETESVNTDLESETKNTLSITTGESETDSLKRRIEEVESSINNNRSVLTPNKIRKMSDSDQISSTTEETEVSNNNKVSNGTRSKYLGRAKRVGLSRPKRCHLTNSPSSDKSVENYAQNSPTPPPTNGKIKTTPRSKVQRYDTSDLYKPKLHYLSRRNNVS